MTRNELLEVDNILSSTDRLPVTQLITTEQQRVHKVPNNKKATVTTVGTEQAQRMMDVEEKNVVLEKGKQYIGRTHIPTTLAHLCYSRM